MPIFTAKLCNLKKAFQILGRIFLSVLLLLIILWGLLETQWGQTWLAHQVTNRLSRDLQSRISIKGVQVSFFNKLNLEGVLVKDQKQDTLLWAGKFQVRMTDWFFFKDTTELKYIGLENALVKFQRTDSVWNYQFLADYFSSPSQPDHKKKQSGIQFHLKTVELNNVTFINKDEWIGEDLVVKVGGLDLNANRISISNKLIDLTRIDLNKPYFHLHDYDGRKPVDTTKHGTIDTTSGWNPEGWTVKANQIKITDGVFRNDRYGLVTDSKIFDADHINFSKINADLKNVRWIKDTIRANVQLSTQERSGLKVQSLTADFRFTPKLMEFENLLLKTNRSVLKDYFAMHYSGINSLNHFIHAVQMEGNFKNASVASEDIAFFASEAKDWKQNIQIEGKVKGSVDALLANNLTLKAGSNTFINGDVSLVGLPNIDETFINLQASDLRTTYADAVQLIPAIRSIKTPNLSKLTYLRFRGSYTGFLQDFVTYGTLQTNLGTLVTDLNMKFPSGKPPVYSGSLATDNFQLGEFINSSALGLLSFKGDVKGKGFKWNTLDVDINGTIHKIQYNKYNYQNISAKGRLNNKMFDGNFDMKDPNADLHLAGLINLSGASPNFDVKANIIHANLKALQLTNDNFDVSGNFNLNFTGRSLSDFLGDAHISNATILQNGKRLAFDSLVVSSRFINGVKTLKARSNELDATITGNFNLQALPDAFTHFLSHYYPAYIKHPYHKIPKQSFTFDITTGVVEDYIKLIDSRLSGFNNSHFSGSLNMADNAMMVDASIPQFSYSQYEFSDIKLNGKGNIDSLILTGQVSNAVVSDSLTFPQTNFTIEAKNDVSNITFNTTANQTINKVDLSAQVKTFSDGLSVLFNPSYFVLNSKTWSIEQGGELELRKKSAVQGQLVLRESNQAIRINTQPSDIGNWNDIHVSLQNINLGDISPFLLKQNRIEGLLTGSVIVEDPQNKFNVTSYIKTDQLRVDNDSIGTVQSSLSYINSSGILQASGNNTDPEHQVLFDLDLNLKDTTNSHQDRITIKAYMYPVKILERFLGDLFSDMQGFVTGQLSILGHGANMDYIGKGKLTNAGLKVNFTQVFYKIDDTEIELTKDAINLGTLKLRDRFGNTATVSGSIKHNSFRNMVFDIEARTDSKPMELLNTTYNDNQQFYGRAMGNGTFTLKGPQNDMLMYINARPSEKDSSYITLPPSRSRESGSADFMVERKYGREMTAEDFKGSATNMTYEIDLAANPLVNIEVILDDLTGDAIRSHGTGDLHIRAGTAEPLSIRGRYDIQDGNYLFTFQSFFKKPFVLRQGGNNYIEWTGDPYGANIHFDAVYKAEQVSFAPLASGLDQTVSGSGTGTDLSRYRGDVNVIATLTGDLFKPTFDFKLEVPGNTVTNNNPSLQFSLQQIEKNPNEINKQVTYLIVFNSFAPFENTQSSSFQPFSEFAYSTISGLFFGEVNRRLNQLLSKIIRNNDLTVNFTGSLYNRNLVDQSAKGFNINQSNLNVTVGVPIINDRFIVTFGSTFDVPLQSTIQQNIQFLPDVTAEWLINKSGSIRATFFYRQNLDFLSAGNTVYAGGTALRTKRSGSSISYRKEFESITEILFGRKKGKLKKQATLKPVTDSASLSQ